MQSLLFDLDGTLLDHFATIAACYEHTLAHFDQPIPSRERIHSSVGGSVEITMRKFVPENIADQAIIHWKDYLLEHLTDDVFLMPGALDLVEYLYKKGHTLGVFTNKVGPHSRALCDHLGVSKYMSAVIGADDTPYRKPDPEFSKYALDKINSTAENTILIGDSPFDIDAAKSVGMISWCVTTGTHNQQELETGGADAVYPNFIELAHAEFGIKLTSIA